MKPKTDPKTLTTRAILASADMTNTCKTIDLLRLASTYECDPSATELADSLAEWVKLHRPAEKRNPSDSRPLFGEDVK